MKADYVHKDSLTATDSELSFKMSDEEIKKLVYLLSQGGLRHFVLKLDDEELDVVEYKEYKKLEERISYLERSIERKDDTIIELRNDNCYCNRTDCSSRIKDSKTYDSLEQKVKSQQQAFIEYLEDEKDRLASEVSHTYEDDLGKTGLINEDIFNEVDKIELEYKEIVGGNNVFR